MEGTYRDRHLQSISPILDPANFDHNNIIISYKVITR